MTVSAISISLAQRLKNGDESAISEIYDQYSSALFGLIIKIVKDNDIAEDVLQDCFITIWQKAKLYNEEKGTLYTWMLNICRNKAIDAYRKTNKEIENKNQIDNSSVYTDELNKQVDHIGLSNVLNKLPEEQHILIELIYYKGMTQQEVSDFLSIPLGTVKTRLRMAIGSLKNILITLITLWMLKNI